MTIVAQSRHSDNSTENATSPPPSKRRRRVHVPHKERPTELVHRRNARERNRVHAVNDAYRSLCSRLPVEYRYRGTRSVLPKVDIIKGAIDYIQYLSNILEGHTPRVLQPEASSNLDSTRLCDDDVRRKLWAWSDSLAEHHAHNNYVQSSGAELQHFNIPMDGFFQQSQCR